MADHQHRLAMRVAAGLGESDVGGQRNVARYLLPCKVKVVAGEPDVFSAAGQRVGPVRGVKLRTPGVKHGADVGVILKEAERRCALRGGDASGQRKRHEKTPEER